MPKHMGSVCPWTKAGLYTVQNGKIDPSESIVHCFNFRVVQLLSRFEGARCCVRRQGDDQPQGGCEVYGVQWHVAREEFDERDLLVYRPIVAGNSWKKNDPDSVLIPQFDREKRRAPYPFAGTYSSACVSKYQEWVAEALFGTMERVSENSRFFLARRVPCDVL
jgi:hypothetical protein